VSSLWRNNGSNGIIVNGSGVPILCASCPCDSGCTLCEYVLERQLAAAQYYITPVICPGSYTLTQMKAYVNAMAPVYVDGTYTGGASAPATLPSTYANAATTEDDLIALVADMVTTVWGDGGIFGSMSYKARYIHQGSGYSAVSNAAAYALAQSDYQQTGYSASGSAAPTVIKYTEDYGTYNALLYSQTLKGHLSGAVSDSTTSTARWFMKSKAYGARTFHKQGFTIPDQNNWGVIQEFVPTIVSNTITSPQLLPTDMPSSTGPDGSPGAGFLLDDSIVLFDWDFECV
jgi:hypothetical protein